MTMTYFVYRENFEMLPAGSAGWIHLKILLDVITADLNAEVKFNLLSPQSYSTRQYQIRVDLR